MANLSGKTSSTMSSTIYDTDSNQIVDRVDTPVLMTEIATPSTPASGFGVCYPKTDGKFYFLSDGGVESDLTVSLTGALLADGSVPLTADWATGAFDIRGWENLEGFTGGIIDDTDGVTFTIKGAAGDYVRIGDAGTTNHSLNAGDDLLVSGDFEVDGTTYLDGNVFFYTSCILRDNVDLVMGNSSDAYFRWNSSQTNDALSLGLGNTSMYMYLCQRNDINFDFAHGNQTNPTLFVHSANQATDEWISFAHDQTDGVISAGTGSVKINNANIASGSIASGVTGVTQSPSDNSTKLATTAYADAAGGGALQSDGSVALGGAWDMNSQVLSNVGASTHTGDITMADGYSINLQEDITWTGATGENQMVVPDDLAVGLLIKDTNTNFITMQTTSLDPKILFHQAGEFTMGGTTYCKLTANTAGAGFGTLSFTSAAPGAATYALAGSSNGASTYVNGSGLVDLRLSGNSYLSVATGQTTMGSKIVNNLHASGAVFNTGIRDGTTGAIGFASGTLTNLNLAVAGTTAGTSTIVNTNTGGAITFRVADSTKMTMNATDFTLANGMSLNLQEELRFSGATGENKITLVDNLANALDITESTNSYMSFTTTNSSEAVNFSQDVEILSTNNLSLNGGSFYPTTVSWISSGAGGVQFGITGDFPVVLRPNTTTILSAHSAGVAIGGTQTIVGELTVKQQDTSGAKEVISLDQDDVSEPFMRLVGESTTDNSQSLVDAADLTTPGQIVGWYKIYVQDDQSTNPITDGTYYVPFYATPTA